jgi:hypothetical protein
MYSIVFSNRAKKELLALPNQVLLLMEVKIDGLANHPRPIGCKNYRVVKMNIEYVLEIIELFTPFQMLSKLSLLSK